MDPENAGADSGNPQSWNGYAYALNNPFRYTDPTGMSQEDGEPYISPQGFVQPLPPCVNGVDQQGNPCYGVTGTAPMPKEPDPEISPLDLPGQFFVGFVDFFLNGRLTGAGRMALVYAADFTGGAIISAGFRLAANLSRPVSGTVRVKRVKRVGETGETGETGQPGVKRVGETGR